MSLTLLTSGSTDIPKQVNHTWEYIKACADRSINEINLTPDDIVFDVFPNNVIAHYTITAVPAMLSGAKLVSSKFNPFTYIEMFEKTQPTVISLIPKHLELLSKTKKWNSIDMSCVRYMVTGSSKIEKSFIDAFRQRGVKIVANWYGMTEMPPPVFAGYNTAEFDFTPKEGYAIDFSSEGECIINGWATGDVFDVDKKIFLRRKLSSNECTWKTNI